MRILLIHPALWAENVLGYGLAMLSATLIGRGHIVKVADYMYSVNIPPVKEVFADFQPDAVGISMFSSAKTASEKAVDDIRSIDSAVPILCGGPHVTSATDELANNKKLDYLVIGEAEGVICEIVENAKRQKHPVLVARPPLPDVDELPFPDYRPFIDYEKMFQYPLLTSRGCPYSCNFCAAGIVSSKKYRPRRIDLILEELKLCKERYKSITSIFMYDDNFNLNKERGKDLLRQFGEAKSKGLLNYNLSAGNFRADSIDEELLLLLKKLGADTVWVGVESANKEVFHMIQKGETLDEISYACGLARKNGMNLNLNFIIGLPGDSFERTYDSIRFARKFRASKMYWSLLVAYKGTSAYQWFKKNGILKDGEYPPAITDNLFGLAPNAYTADFWSGHRANAQRLARIVSAEVPLWSNLIHLYSLWRQYKVPMDILFSWPIFRFCKAKTQLMFWLRLARLFFHDPRISLFRLRVVLRKFNAT